MRTSDGSTWPLAIEAAAFGVGYACVLVWIGAALVGSFRSGSLADPYWPDIPWLRTDTTGVIAFALSAASLVVSRYLQLRRMDGRADAARQPRARRVATVLVVQALAETAAVLGTGLVAYLSLNAVTHNDTLRLQLTHLWPWPSEGTVRVIALLVCAISVAIRRYLRAAALTGGSGRGRVVGDGFRWQVEQPAPDPDLEPGLGR